MNAPAAELRPPAGALRRDGLRHWPLLAGAVAIAAPTMAEVGRQSWSTEQGAHGPLVLATGLWLLARLWPQAAPLRRAPAGWRMAALLVPALLLYLVARIAGILEVEGVAMYAVLLVALYGVVGGAALRALWFPLCYLCFIFPPPDQLVATLTQPLKIGISHAAVALLDLFGLPISRTGVIIQVAQYDVLVAAACAGLNSIISLSAIGLFYIYLRHNAHWRYALLLVVVAILPVAVASNFARVLALILITYWFGDAAAQGFLHEFAGLAMFLVALLLVVGIDAGLAPLRERLR